MTNSDNLKQKTITIANSEENEIQKALFINDQHKIINNYNIIINNKRKYVDDVDHH